MRKQIHTWHTLELENAVYQYFYKHEGYTVNGITKFRIFLLDADLKVYEFILHEYESFIEDELARILCEGEL